MSAALGDRIMALAGVAGAVWRDAADLLALRYPAEKVGQHRRIADMAPGDLDGSNQRLSVDPEMDPAPDAPLRATVLACMPFVEKTVRRTVS